MSDSKANRRRCVNKVELDILAMTGQLVNNLPGGKAIRLLAPILIEQQLRNDTYAEEPKRKRFRTGEGQK